MPQAEHAAFVKHGMEAPYRGPDNLAVIADSFGGYLETLMENEYDFINEDTVDE